MPRSITLAICSRPCVNLMLSTAVSMVGNVLSTSVMLHARGERRVALRIEGLGLRHPAGHPQHDDGVGRGWLLGLGGSPASGAPARMEQIRLPARERSERRAGGRTHEAAAADARVDELFFAGHTVLSAQLQLQPYQHFPPEEATDAAISFRIASSPSCQWLQRAISKSAETRASSSPPTADLPVLRRMDELRATGRAAPLRRRERSACRRRAPQRVAEHAVDRLGDRAHRRRRRQRPPAAAEASRSMSGGASKTKNLICGSSVEPISAGGFSRPMTPRKLVNLLPAMSYATTDGFWTRTPAPVAPPTSIGPVPARSPEPSSGVSSRAGRHRQARRAPPAPTRAAARAACSSRSPGQ